MNPSTALATVLVDELVRADVREVVLCPGSRSAPLAYAVLAAERAGRLRLHVRVDERSAGFLALGLAKASRRPAVVVTTSGTAVANLLPAVLEAHHAQVPMLVLSADRPAELRGTGANQTTTQPGILGEATRWSHDLPAPELSAEARPELGAYWRATVCRAVAAAGGRPAGSAGPVHLNVAFREPLVPADVVVAPVSAPDAPVSAPDAAASAPDAAGSVLASPWAEALDGRPGGRPWVTVAPPEASGVASPEAGSIENEPLRTLVIVGDLPDPAAVRAAMAWAGRRGWPVIAEPFGEHPRDHLAVAHAGLVLAVPRWVDAFAPQRVIVVGRPTLSRPVSALLRRTGLLVELVTAGAAWADPSHVASRVHPWSVISGDPALEAPDAPEAPAGRQPDHASVWSLTWWAAGVAVAEALAASAPLWPSGPALARTMFEAIPPRSTLFVSSSNSVRDLDVAAGPCNDGVVVVASRGLSGIDGCVSSAVGIALASGEPTYALVGDLAFLHDANGLLIGPHEPRPDLTVVVANDDGGGIFTLLEPGEPSRAGDFERIFGTPTGVDLGDLCRAHGVAHTLVGSADELRTALVARGGLRVLEVRLNRSAHRAERARLLATATAALVEPG